MNKVILQMLNEDMVSHGWVSECVKNDRQDGTAFDAQIKNTLSDLLSSGLVEIGNARIANPQYVEFVAWRGTIVERVSRAMNAVRGASNTDKEFAYWLALRQNVDRFEEVK